MLEGLWRSSENGDRPKQGVRVLMRVVLTGGSGDLGQILCPMLVQRGDVPVVLDVRPPHNRAEFVDASITDRKALAEALPGADMVIHIAAWHGVHEFRKEKDVYEFWDLNVTGTFNVFQAAADAAIDKVIFISSTSIDERFGVYGHTKVLCEEIVRAYVARHGMSIVTLRPRAFIPHWNRTIYSSYIEWANWFWGGAVHIDDVAQAVMRGVDYLASGQKTQEPLFLPVDGAYEYTDDDLKAWDKEGAGSTFKKYYSNYIDLANEHGLDPARKPKRLDISETRRILKYEPRFSLKNLLEELAEHGAKGPPAPVP